MKRPLINKLKIWRTKCTLCGWRIPKGHIEKCGYCSLCCIQHHSVPMGIKGETREEIKAQGHW
jgi:hypothetical protein